MKNKKTLRVIVFVLLTALLIGMLPAYAAEDTTVTIVADTTVTNTGTKTVTLSRDDPYYMIKLNITAKADYAIWSAADSTCDPYLELLDNEGYILNYDDDRNFDYNFKLIQELEPGEYYLKITNYDKSRKVSFPVSVAKAQEPTDINVSLWYPTMSVGTTNYVSVTYLPGNSYEPDIVLSSSNSGVAKIDSDEIIALKPGESVITATVEDTTISNYATLNVTGTQIKANTPASGEVSYAKELVAYYFTAPSGGRYSFIVNAENNVRLAVSDGDTSDEKLTKSGVVGITLSEGEVCSAIVEMSKLPSDYTLTVKRASDPADMTVRTESGKNTYAAGDTDNYIIEYDDIAALPSSVTVTSSDPSVVQVSEYGSFKCLKKGTAVITVKARSSRTLEEEINLTVVNPTEITLTKSHTSTLKVTEENGSTYGHVMFKAPSAGDYQFTVTNNRKVNIELSSFEPYMIGDNTIQLRGLGAGQEVILEYSVNLSKFTEDVTFSGDVSTTVSAKKLATAGSTVIAEGASFTGYVGQTVVFNPGGYYNNISWKGDNDNVSVATLSNDGASTLLVKEGKSAVTLTTERGSKKIDVTIKPKKEIRENTAVTSKFNSSLYLDMYLFKPAVSGFYNIEIVSPGYSFVSVDRTYDDKWITSNAAYGNHTVSGYFETGYEYEISVEGGYPQVYDCTLTIKHMSYATSVYCPAGNLIAYAGEEFDTAGVGLRFGPVGAVSERITSISSSNEAVAQTKGLKDNKVLAAKKVGTATIYVETEYGLKTSFTLTIVDNNYIPCESIKLNTGALTLKQGETGKLAATVTGTRNRVYWDSSNPAIVSVDVNGNINALKSGTAVIYARCDNEIAECIVTVPMVGLKDTTKIFRDVQAGKWYVNAINYSYSNGFIAGMSSTEFGVGTPVTRGMFITILARIAGVDTGKAANNTATVFTDVARGKYYTAAIKWANEASIVKGMTATTFAPDAPIQRQQLCVMIVNFALTQNVQFTTLEAAASFADGGSIANYAKKAVTTCQVADIVNGYNENGKAYFKPTNTATRAEAAQILYKFHNDFMVG